MIKQHIISRFRKQSLVLIASVACGLSFALDANLKKGIMALAETKDEIEAVRYSKSVQSEVFASSTKEPVDRELLTALTEVLRNSETMEARQAAAFILGTLPVESLVADLCESLREENSFEPARYVLEQSASSQSVLCLADALEGLDALESIAVMNSLGRIGSEVASQSVADMLESEDEMVIAGALENLGRIGGEVAFRELLAFDPGASERVTRAYNFSIARVIESLPDDAKIATSLEQLEVQTNPLIRRALYLQLLSVDASASTDRFLEELNSPDSEFHRLSIRLVQDGTYPTLTLEIAAKLHVLPEASASDLLSALALRGDSNAEHDILKLIAETQSEDLRIKGVEALAKTGTEKSVSAVIKYMEQQPRQSRLVADTLCFLRGDEVDSILLSEISSVSERQVPVLLSVLSCRNVTSSIPFLIETANSENRRIAAAAIEAIGTLGGENELSSLLEFMTGDYHKAISRGATDAYVNVGRRNLQLASSKLLLEKYPSAEGEEARANILKATAQIGSDEGLNLLLSIPESDDYDEETRKSALRALAGWPNSKPASRLLKIVETEADTTLGVLALRGYLEVIKFQEDPNERFASVQAAIPSANSEGAIRQLLSAMSTLEGEPAMMLAAGFLDTEGIAVEAAVAMAQIAGNGEAFDPHPDLKPLIQRAAEIHPEDSGRELLGRMLSAFSPNHYLLAWDVSGPHSVSLKKDISALLDHAFEPENAGGDWKTIRGGTDPNQPWYIDLQELYEGDNQFEVAYLKTWLRIPEATDVIIDLGTDDAIKVWLNQEVIYENDTNRPANPGDDRVEVHFPLGTNELMIKVVQGIGGWGAVVGFEEGEPGKLDEALVKGAGMFMVPLETLNGGAPNVLRNDVPVWSTETWEADPFTGEYVGSRLMNGEEEQFSAKVWSDSDSDFNAILQSSLVEAYNPVYKTKLNRARGEAKRLEFVDPGWSGFVSRDFVYATAPDGAQIRLERHYRVSPTLGKEAPNDAIVLFDGTNFDEWDGERDGTITWELLANQAAQVTAQTGGIRTKRTFGDFELHLEFRLPYSPGNPHQFYGNSGVFLNMAYEVQILNSFGLPGSDDEAGAFYKVKAPDVNASLPPLQWQTYDITFRNARFSPSGELSEPARATVYHNGILVQDDIELATTTIPEIPPPADNRQILIQDHHNQVQFRNIWIRELN